MARLFTGVFPSDTAAAETVGLRTLVDEKRLRWMPEGNLHTTLVFVGGVPDDDVPEVEALLAPVRFDAFDLALTGVGAFPTPRAARVLWAGLEPPDPVLDLQARVAEALEPAVESRNDSPGTYHPHVTIARCRGRFRLDARPWIERHAEFSGQPFRVNTFTLVQSRTKPEGAEYTVIGRFGDGRPAGPRDS